MLSALRSNGCIPREKQMIVTEIAVSESIKSWLVRLPFIVLLAASMGWLGLILLFLGTPFFPVLDDFWTQTVIVASIAIWGVATFFLRGRQLSTWMGFGAISPLLGALVVAPPASIAFVMIKAYIAVPVGLLTGIVMYWIVSTNIRNKSD